MASEAKAKGAGIVAFPEMSVCGYTCADLFGGSKLISEAEEAVRSILELSAGLDIIMVFGAPVRYAGRLFNCALVSRAGRLLGIVPKTYLAGNAEFYEPRWFESARVLPDGGELPAGFSDGGKVLFLSDGGKGDGFSPLTPIERPFSAVMKLIQSAPAYCAVVPIGRYSALSSVTLSDFGGKYFFGGVYAGIDWRAFFGAELRLGATLAFGTDAVVDCLSVVSATNSAYLAANCHSLTIGKSVVTSRDTDRAVDYYPSVVGGAVLADGASVELSSTDLTVWSGTWRYAYAGNILTSGGVTPRTITGNTSLTVNGGVYTGGVSANGMNHLTGDATLTVNGGVFKCSVYGTAVASPSVGKTARIKGNVTVTLNRGEFRGDLLFAQRDEDVEFEGRYVLTVAGGDISRVNAIRGIDSLAKNTGAESELNLSTEISTTAPQSGTVTVENPIAGFADPSVYFHDGWYYYTYSRDYNGGPALWMTRSPNVADLSASEPVLIWSAKVAGNTMKSLWAPQIYFLDGKW